MENIDAPLENTTTQDAAANQSEAAGRHAVRLTRPVVAELLQVSVATVRRLEGTLLHPLKGPDGVYVFESGEVQRAAQARPQLARRQEATEGEIAAAAFALFKKGIQPRDVVIELERPPAEIVKLNAQWESLNNRLVLSSGTLEALARVAHASMLDYDILNCLLSDDAEELRALATQRLQEQATRKRRPAPSAAVTSPETARNPHA